MARYKPQDHNSLLLPVVLSEQIIPGSFAFTLNYLVDHELDLGALDAQFKNDEVGASAYDPRAMLKIVLLRSHAASGHPISARALGAMPGAAGPIPLPGVPICMRRGAQLWADQGWRLFEPQASLARPRPKRAPQVPVAPAEGADSWGAFLLVTFLLRKRTSYFAAGRNSRPGMLAGTQNQSASNRQ